ncbi:hypothetical protein I5535_18315 [Rhodobacteraceae bacterium F11138]|nr:hypothetical protein [Rhodobacteraceae bacterium F11138]
MQTIFIDGFNGTALEEYSAASRTVVVDSGMTVPARKTRANISPRHPLCGIRLLSG